MANETAITAEYARATFDYDPATGVVRWKLRPDKRAQWNSRFSGKPAGSVTTNGYIQILVDGMRVVAHRLAWLYVTGEWPSDELDHINGNPQDNRIANLRPATRAQNNRSRRMPKRNIAGLKGVSFDKQSGRWAASIVANKRTRHLGRFNCKAAAHFAYVIAASELHGQFARYD